MSDNRISRRDLLQAAGGATLLRLTPPVVAAIAQAACTARDERSAFTVLAADEAADFSAIAARIIPTTDTPGATEAGVIHFFDQAFASEMSDSLEPARAGLDNLNVSIGDRRFSELDEGEQDARLQELDGTRYFEVVRTMTIFGFFALSRYGGNKDNIAWKLIDFDGHHGAWRYPFGAYDAKVHGETGGGD